MIEVQVLGSSSKGNAYRLRSKGRSLLLECGLPWKEIRKKLNFETTSLDGCLVTHSHGDHCRAAADVIKAGVDLYCTQDAFAEMGIIGYHHRFKPVSVAGGYSSSVWEFTIFETVHDAPGPCGYLINDGEEVLVFITDTAYCKYKFPALDIIMIEANFSDDILQRNIDSGAIDPARAKRVRENHMSIERVIDFLKANNLSRCREIHLLHLSDGNSSADLFKKMVQEATGIPTYVAG